VSAIVRLTLLAHGMTEAMSAGRFPDDEPLSPLGVRQVAGVGDLGHLDRILAGPETRTRQTAEQLGCQPDTDPRLADLDYGCWRGEDPASLAPAALAEWITNPASAPHGGESLTTLMMRTADWLDSITRAPGRVVAVTHPAVIRAAVLIVLNAPPESFWRVDVPPASRTALRHRRAWTLQAR
jgi:broad specificity phosphatase PhoE